MEDEKIVSLYWERNEQAVTETKTKYGKYLYTIAYNVLSCPEDAEECENDTYLAAWNGMPPHRPGFLSAFLGKITRNLSLKKHRCKTAQKRGGGEADLSLEELAGCIPQQQDFDARLEAEDPVDFSDYDFVAMEYMREGYTKGDPTRISVPFYTFYKDLGEDKNGIRTYAKTYVPAIRVTGLEEYFSQHRD